MKKDNIIYADFTNDPSTQGAKTIVKPRVTAIATRTINGLQVHTNLHNLSPVEFAHYLFRQQIISEKEHRIQENI